MTTANRHAAAGRYDEALGELSTLLQSHPRHLQAIQTKGQIEAALGRLDEAIRSFEQAFAIDARDPVTLASLVNVYQAASRFDDAERTLRTWLAVGTSDDNAKWRSLGEVKWQAAERLRNSSVFTDAEEGCPQIEDLSDADGDIEAASIDRLQERAEAWALLLAAQKTVLGRLDTLMTLAKYQNAQGRMRVQALGLYRAGAKGISERSASPPAAVPRQLVKAFSMNGRVEISEGYIDSTFPPEYRSSLRDDDIRAFLAFNRANLHSSLTQACDSVLGDFSIDDHVLTRRAFERTRPPGAYEFREPDLSRRLFSGLKPAGRNIAILGEAEPFIASICVGAGARVTIVTTTPVDSDATLVKVERVDDWLKDEKKFDLIICRPLIDAWGLGGFGEEIDPDGDCKLIGRLTNKVATGGDLCIELPIGRDRLIFNAMRVYGECRLPYLMKHTTLQTTMLPKDSDLTRRKIIRQALQLKHVQR